MWFFVEPTEDNKVTGEPIWHWIVRTRQKEAASDKKEKQNATSVLKADSWWHVRLWVTKMNMKIWNMKRKTPCLKSASRKLNTSHNKFQEGF